MLGQLDETAEEQVEIRLLSDAGFAEEFDITVDEITNEYVGGDSRPEDRERIEQYFLKAPERQEKLKFAEALAGCAGESVTSNVPSDAPEPPSEGLFQRLSSLWRTQTPVLSFASVIVLLGLVAVIVYVATTKPSQVLAVNLQISNVTRGDSSDTQSILRPSSGVVSITLMLPLEASPTARYRVELGNLDAPREIPIARRDTRSVTVEIPASDLLIGHQSFKLTAINDDGSEVPVSGSYRLNVK